MMKKITILFTFFLASMAIQAQHYYKDLVTSTEIMQKQALYRANKVKTIQCHSLDQNNEPIDGFSNLQTISNNFTEITTNTKAPLIGKSQNIATFATNGQLLKTVDTSEGNKVVITYTYDAANRIAQVNSLSSSPGGLRTREEHKWFYNAAGKPERMIKIKNQVDTTYVTFIPDEKGNIGEEKSMHGGTAQPTIYYYYDEHNRLTDVVRYNDRAKRLMPDYMFEYDEQGRMTSMMIVQLTADDSGGIKDSDGRRKWFSNQYTFDYQKWYYTYNEKGLKQKDECYSKSKALIGKVEYTYQF
jgi:hypothetical protein